MFKNRSTALCIGCLCLLLCLPAFSIGGEKTDVASWFIHDDPSCIKQDATAQNELAVVAKLALQEGRGSQASPDFNRDPVIRGLTTTYVIPWSVLNEGGKTNEATSASYRLKDAIGQPVIGKCESANYKAHIGFWSPGIIQIVGVEEKQGAGSTMQETRLSQNYPNPFTERTSIQYAVASRQRKDKNFTADYCLLTTLKIYDLTGRLVKTFDLPNNFTVSDGQSPHASRTTVNQVVWNGTDDQGQKVAPGVYFYKLETSDYRAIKKMILLR